MKQQVRMKGMEFQRREVVRFTPDHYAIHDYFTHRKSGATVIRKDAHFPLSWNWGISHMVEWQTGIQCGSLSDIVQEIVTQGA